MIIVIWVFELTGLQVNACISRPVVRLIIVIYYYISSFTKK